MDPCEEELVSTTNGCETGWCECVFMIKQAALFQLHQLLLTHTANTKTIVVAKLFVFVYGYVCFGRYLYERVLRQMTRRTYATIN